MGLENRETTSPIGDQITLLLAGDGKKLAKRFEADGSKRQYDNAYRFASLTLPASSIQELGSIMRYVAEHRHRNICVIRGAARPRVDKNQVHRRTLAKYDDVPRRWVILDIDDLALPDDISPTSQKAVEFAIRQLLLRPTLI
jgi:hypothetical protein